MEGFVFENVWKRYGATIALRNVSTTLGRGLNVIVGPNGSGKTTMLRIMLGFAKPSRGRVLSLGRDPWKQREDLLRVVGLGFEWMGIPWWLRGVDVLKLYASRRGLDWSTVKEYAELLGVTNYWNRVVRGYSSGMKKKLLLTLAFVGAREALVLDEPYTLLDRRSVEIVDNLVAKHSKHMPVVVATHTITPRIAEADKALILFEGRIVYETTSRNETSELMCVVEDLGKALSNVIELSKHVKYLEFDGKNLVVAFDSSVKLSNLRGARECRPSLYTALRYEKVVKQQASKDIEE